MKNLILRPKSYLRIIYDLNKIQWLVPMLACLFLILVGVEYILELKGIGRGESLGERRSIDEPINRAESLRESDLPSVTKDESGNFTVSGELINKDYEGLLEFLERKTTDVEALGISPWILIEKQERARELYVQGKEAEAVRELLGGIRLAEEIMLSQKIH